MYNIIYLICFLYGPLMTGPSILKKVRDEGNLVDLLTVCSALGFLILGQCGLIGAVTGYTLDNLINVFSMTAIPNSWLGAVAGAVLVGVFTAVTIFLLEGPEILTYCREDAKKQRECDSPRSPMFEAVVTTSFVAIGLGLVMGGTYGALFGYVMQSMMEGLSNSAISSGALGAVAGTILFIGFGVLICLGSLGVAKYFASDKNNE